MSAMLAIARERRRQDALKASGRFRHTAADPELTDPERLAILAEEFGEVAREVAEAVGSGQSANIARLREELVQVAAVAVAWIDGIDRRSP